MPLCSKWWHRLVPTYGNWGGPCCYGGSHPEAKPIDAMDNLFKTHREKCQCDGYPTNLADINLIIWLWELEVTGWVASIYRIGAIVAYGSKTIVGLWRQAYECQRNAR